MVVRLQKLQAGISSESSLLQSADTQGQAHPMASNGKPALDTTVPSQKAISPPPQQTSNLPVQQTSNYPVQQTSTSSQQTSHSIDAIELDSSAEAEVCQSDRETTRAAVDSVSGLPEIGATSDGGDFEAEDDFVDSRLIIRRDRSHTWSHSTLSFKPGQTRRASSHVRPMLLEHMTPTPLQQSTIAEVPPEGAFSGDGVHQQLPDENSLGLGPCRLRALTPVTTTTPSLDSSFEDDRSESVSSRRSLRGRDRSHTWSHGTLAAKTARRSGSLTPMDSAMSHVPKLDLNEGRDSPFPSSTTPTCMSPFRLGKLLVCSEHRMSTSPRLPPIGCVSDVQASRHLPKNSPRELVREVTAIDPGLVDNGDPTEVRMMGRRRNAILTPQPYSKVADS